MTNHQHITLLDTQHVPKRHDMRTVWNQSAHVRSFYLNGFGEHFLTSLNVLVKVRDKVMVRAGTHGWNVYYRGTVILLDFIRNLVRSVRTRKVTFHAPQERSETCQIAGVLHLGSEYRLNIEHLKGTNKLLQIFRIEDVTPGH